MSRAYEYVVIVSGLSSEEEATMLEKVVADELGGYDDRSGLGHFPVEFWGSTNLCGGETEEQAHERVAAAIKGKFKQQQMKLRHVAVRSRWTYVENLPFEEYGDEIDE
jgi:hypothetical protein